MKNAVLKFFLVFFLLLGLGSCGSPTPGGSFPDGGGGGSQTNPITPTPPVPVFGNFVMGVATSHPENASSQSTRPSSLAASQEAPSTQATRPSKSLISLPGVLSIEFGGIKVSQTRQTISQISFKPDNGPQTDIQFPATYVVELIKDGEIIDQEFPDFGVTTIPFDTYHSFEMKFETLESGEIPSELLEDLIVTLFLKDNSIVVQGSFTLSIVILGVPVNREVPLLIVSDQSPSIRVSSPNAFTVSAGQVNYFFIAFRVNDWFEGLFAKLQQISLADLVDGALTVSENHPSALVQEILSLFEQNVNSSARIAPSQDPAFQETDVDLDSSSIPF